MAAQYTIKDVKSHDKDSKEQWIIVDNTVYNVTDFAEEHPGGSKILLRVAGKDASKQFWKYHNEHVLHKHGEKLKIGTLKEEAKL